MVGGTLETYIAGSTTPATTWQDSALTIANTNPISLDARGECVLWLDPAVVYKFVLKNAPSNGGVVQWTQDNISTPAALANSLRSDLAAPTGASLIGGGGQVVSSIAALRSLLKTSASKNARVTGYYAAGDGGGGSYWYDATDTTTADNGGTVIVASDGGRWKLSRLHPITAKQLGAKGDNVNNDYPALQALFSTGLRGYKIPEGQWSFDTGLVSDYRTAFPAPGNPSARFDVSGESMANTILSYTGAGFALNMYGSDTAGAGQGVHSLDLLRNFTLQDKEFNRTSSGMCMQNRAWWKVADVFCQYLDVASEFQSCYTGKVDNAYFSFSNVGTKLTTNAMGASNALTFDRCTWTGNIKQAVLGVATGTANAWRGCDFEGNGTHGDMGMGAVIMNVGAYGVAGPVKFEDCYFEANKGLADISIDNTTAQPLDVIIDGCFFNRTSATEYVKHNLSITSSGGGRVRVHLRGNSFASLGNYAPDAARPFWTGTADLVEFIDEGGNSYNETTSIVQPFTTGRVVCGDVSSAGARLNGPGFITASRLSAGVYRLVASGSGFGKTTDFYSVTATSIDSGGTTAVRNIVKQNGTTFDVTTTNNAFAPTDGAFTFSVMLRGGA